MKTLELALSVAEIVFYTVAVLYIVRRWSR